LDDSKNNQLKKPLRSSKAWFGDLPNELKEQVVKGLVTGDPNEASRSIKFQES
jgi:hypothetical protein